MNVVTAGPQTPGCFGQDWDSKEPECAGGPHPTRRNPRDGSHTLDRCNFFASCGARTAATRNANGTLIPAQNLVRPPVVTPPPAPQPAPQTFAQWMQNQPKPQPVPTYPGTPTATMPQPAAPQAVQPQAHFMPGAPVHPAQTWQLNYSSPPFLSTPEMKQPGETIWAVLFREVLRAMLKGAAHAAAHFFDARPLKGPSEK